MNFRRWRICVTVVMAASLGGPALALDMPPSAGPSVPMPPANPSYAYSTSIRYGADGLMYAWDGHQIWRQTAAGATTFSSIGTVNTAGADAGPINFSADGATLVIGDGAGGLGGSSNGLIYTLPATGGVTSTPVATAPFNVDLAPVPTQSTMASSATKMYVDRGFDFFGSSSEVDVVDFVSGATTPLIVNIPGASASLAIDSQRRVYVGVGYGPQQGQLRRFTLAQLDAAAAGSPLNYSDGQLFNSADNNSAAGLFFDRRGFLFSGGQDGVTVFNNVGVGQLYSTGKFSYATVAYNPASDQVAVYTPFVSAASIYSAGDFRAPVSWNVDASGAWSAGANWNTQAAPRASDVVVLPARTTSARTITLTAPSAVGALSFEDGYRYLINGDSPLTLGSTAAGAVVAVSGQHEIAAPLVMPSVAEFQVAEPNDQLTLSGGASGPGGIKKTGSGVLTLTAANTYLGDTQVADGRLTLAVTSGNPTVGVGAHVTIADGATLELAGDVSALGAAGGPRAHISNNAGTSGGMVVTSGQHVVGLVDGDGSTTIAADSGLTVDGIQQNSLEIDGAAGHPGLLTIAASSAGQASLMAAVQVGQQSSLLGQLLARRGFLAMPPVDSVQSAAAIQPISASELATVPEPATLPLSLLAFVTFLASRACRSTNITAGPGMRWFARGSGSRGRPKTPISPIRCRSSTAPGGWVAQLPAKSCSVWRPAAAGKALSTQPPEPM